MERDVLRKVAEQQKTTPQVEAEEKPFDLRTAGPIELQQVIGNRATSSLLKGGKGPVVQTKMTVTDADDAHEKEADKVADTIVSGGKASAQRASEEEMAMKRLQRVEEETDEDQISEKRLQRVEEETDEDQISEKRLQRAMTNEEEAPETESTEAPASTPDPGSISDDELQAKRIDRKPVDMSKSFDVGGQIEDQIRGTSGGQKLDAGIQAKMESGTGHSFDNVRVHTDSKADALSSNLGARAFTTGTDIFFKQGQYNPGSDEGQKLIAHEATHVIQQGGTQMKREED